MAQYHQYCPIARASEILADRWTLLIVRELLLGSRHFNEISRGLPGISRSLLVSRLRLLEDGGVVERCRGGQPHVLEYQLTAAGDDLRPVVDRFGAWGVRWAFGEPKPEELDPALLVWRMHQRVHRDRLPPCRTVIEFDFTGTRSRRVWLVLTPREVSVCLKPPGFDSDLIVHADLSSFYGVWLGKTEYDAAIRCGTIVIEGAGTLTREFPNWFKWSPMAVHVRAENERRLVERASN